MSELPSYSAEHIAANYPNRTDASLLSGPYTPTCIAVREIDRLTSCISESQRERESVVARYEALCGHGIDAMEQCVAERDGLRNYAVAQTQLLDRAIKMMQMAGYGVAPHDADHNNPVIAWMAEARELLAKNPAPSRAMTPGTAGAPVGESAGGSAGCVHETGRDWTEDAAHENGNYQNQCVECGEFFIGHKRRHVCKLCVAAYSGSCHQSCTEENVAENAYHDATDLIEEAIKAGADLPRSLLESLDILLRHYASRHQVGQWISASERCPALRAYVVAWETAGKLHCTIAQYRGTAGWFGPWDEEINVTHWMPLPTAPSSEFVAGKKSCSRCGGKGTIGVIYADEPDHREPCPECVHAIGRES